MPTSRRTPGRVVLPQIEPILLERRPQPFSNPDWVFEPKYDGFSIRAGTIP